MKTASISIHTKRISALSSEYTFERALWRTAVGALIVLASSYAYFVTASVLHVMERRAAEVTIEHLSVEVSALERNFLTKAESLTRDLARNMGLKPVSDAAYVQGVQPVVDAAHERPSGL